MYALRRQIADLSMTLAYVWKMNAEDTRIWPKAWVSGLPKGLGERRFYTGEGGGGEEKGRPDTKPFSKSCDTSKIWMRQWLDNAQYPLTSPTASKYEQSDRRGDAIEFFIDVLISCGTLWTETQRGIQKGSSGRSQVLSWNKNKTRARIVFSKPLSLKERCSRSMENLIYQLLPWGEKRRPQMRLLFTGYFCLNYIRVLVSQDRDKEDDISASEI